MTECSWINDADIYLRLPQPMVNFGTKSPRKQGHYGAKHLISEKNSNKFSIDDPALSDMRNGHIYCYVP